MSETQRVRLAEIKFGEVITMDSLNLPELEGSAAREAELVLRYLAVRPLTEVAQSKQLDLYTQLKTWLTDEIGMFTGGLLRLVREIQVASARQYEARRLQFVIRTTGVAYTQQQLADISVFDLLKMVIDHPHAAPYVEDLIQQRVKRVKGVPWIVPLAQPRPGHTNIHLDATMRNLHRYDGLAEVSGPPIREGMPVQPIAFRDAFKDCGVF